MFNLMFLSKFYLNRFLLDVSQTLGSTEALAEKLTVKPIDIHLIRPKIVNMLNEFIQALPVIVLGLFILTLFLITGTIIKNIIKNYMLKHKHYSVGLLMARMAQFLFFVLGILIALSIIFPSITAADLFALLGVGTIAIGFALKNVLNNYISGIFILIHEPFKIGDEIKYRDFEGKVEFIDTRNTFLKSYDGRKILIPNGDIYANTVTINTSYQGRFIEIDVGIACDADLHKATEVILNILKKNKDILQTPEPEVFVIELGDFKNILRARWWTNDYQINVLRAKSAVLKSIKKEFDEQHIEIPYQTQVVRLENHQDS